MQEIKGRVCNDATIETVNEKNVVKFTLAYDAGYYAKGTYHKHPVFYRCSYWLNTGIADLLTTGTHIAVFGNLRPKPFVKNNQELDPGLNFHVDHIDINAFHHNANEKTQDQGYVGADVSAGSDDDLPF